ncbi:MAG: FtsX-like permease family protein [Anaerolineales bacterium]
MLLERFSFYIKHSINDLRVNRQRTLFALLCIMAGVAAIVSLQTLGVMIDDTLTGSLRETNRADIRILPNPPFGEDVDIDARAEAGLVDAEDGPVVFTPDGIEAVRTWFEENYDNDFTLTYQHAISGNVGFSIRAPEQGTDKLPIFNYVVDSDVYPLFGAIESVEGDSLESLLQEPTDIVLSQNLADDLGVDVGATIELNGASEPFTLTGIVPTDAQGGFENLGANILGYYFLDFSAMELFEDVEPRQANTIFIALDDPATVDAIESEFIAEYPYLSATTTTDLEEQNTTISNSVNDLVVIMGLVSMLIGGIGIVNTMLVIVSRRATEVAVLKTLGLEPEEITVLFLVEAVIMGVLGSILGIFIGWGMAAALQSIPESFVAQDLTFRFTLEPALNGFIVGVLITAIFGFLPTLAAGQIRPANVLRPSEDLIPTAGRLRAFVALMIVLLALSVVAQGLLGDLLGSATIGSETDRGAEQNLLDDPTAEVSTSDDLPGWVADIRIVGLIAGINGAIIGLIMGVPVVIGGYLSRRENRRGRSWAVFWLLYAPALVLLLPLAVFLFGYFVPALLIVTGTFLLVGSLYLLLLLLTWAVGGGAIREFPVIGGLPNWARWAAFIFFPIWTALVVAVALLPLPGLVQGLFFGLLFFVHIPAVLVTLTLPAWIIGQALQRFGFLDLKIALRSMVAAKARVASTLLALVIGIFTLGMITMMVDAILNQFNELLEDVTGGNVIIFPSGGEDNVDEVRMVINETGGVENYIIIRNYSVELTSIRDASAETTLQPADLEARIRDNTEDDEFQDPEFLVEQFRSELNSVDARELDSNLPNYDFFAGRQLDPQRDTAPGEDGYWPIVIPANDATLAADLEVNDLITVQLVDEDDDAQEFTFQVVGLTDQTGGAVAAITSGVYVPVGAFDETETQELYFIAEVAEDSIPQLRRALTDIPGVFVLETRLLNDLINSVVRQFTSFPTLVAALALFTGGVVIANSVALATLERRREIAIMKAVGLQRERVIGMLLLENAIMGLIGGLIGVGSGVIILALLLTGLFQGELGDTIPFEWAFALMGLCIVIALVAAVFSVWGASGEKPLNVLRYE